MILVVSNLFTRPSLVLFCLVTCLILTAVRTTQIASWGGSRKCSDLFHERRDCGYRGISQEACEKAHCCWRPAPDDRGIPWCFHPKEGQLMEAHYEVDSIQLMGKGRKIVLKHRFPHLEPTAEHTLVLEERHQKGIVNIKIKSAASAEEGYNPLESIFESFSGYPMPDQEPCRMDQSGLRVDISHGPFQLAVRRAEDHGSNALFSTAARTNEDSFNSIIFKDLFIQLGTHLPRGHNIYGLGECASRFRRSPRRMAFNNRDTPASINQNLYGAHPFYLEMRPNGRAHGVLMLTANPMEVDLGDDYLVYRMIGGQIDLYFFAGPTPDDVIEQYTRIVGRPPLYNPRFLGLHQCRFGYRTLDAWAEVVKGFEDAQLPLEGIWFDIDYMKDYDIFTMDPERYPPAKTLLFTKEQQAKGRMVIPIIDPGVSSRRGFAPYDTGLESNVFLRSADGSSLYADYAWPKVHVHFPDFFHQSTSDYWHSLLAEFKQKLIPFDGLWLDMCEPASLQPAEKPIPPHPGHKKYDLNYPPFAINNGNEERDIFRNTINMDVLHVDGKTRHITLHNAYGAAIARRTAEALELMEPGKRHFILTRSTFPGSGRFTAHWLGDNYSDFENMRLSIAGMMDFQLFGIPMVGADICGFHGTSNPELCARWMALGSFYPFARNHNSERVENTPQEPYRWPIVTEVTRKYFALRYSLLPYWITLLRNAHDSGRPVIRPLFFEFPGLLDIYRDIDEIFMLGSVLLVVPVLTQIDTVEFMIPPGIWYDLLDEKSLPITKHHPEKITLRANLLTLPVLLRGGYALFRQEPKLTIQDTLLSPYELLVALGRDGKAIGTSYFDDGESANPESHQTTTVEIEAETRGNQIIVSFQGHYGYRIIPRLERIVILSAEPCFCSIIGINMEQLQQSWDPIRNAQARANRLTLVGLSIDLNQPLHLSITLEHHQPEDTQLPTLETLTINSSTGSQCLPKHDHSY